MELIDKNKCGLIIWGTKRGKQVFMALNVHGAPEDIDNALYDIHMSVQMSEPRVSLYAVEWAEKQHLITRYTSVYDWANRLGYYAVSLLIDRDKMLVNESTVADILKGISELYWKHYIEGSLPPRIRDQKEETWDFNTGPLKDWNFNLTTASQPAGIHQPGRIVVPYTPDKLGLLLQQCNREALLPYNKAFFVPLGDRRIQYSMNTLPLEPLEPTLTLELEVKKPDNHTQSITYEVWIDHKPQGGKKTLSGNKVTQPDIKKGDRIEIRFSGDKLLEYPKNKFVLESDSIQEARKAGRYTINETCTLEADTRLDRLSHPKQTHPSANFPKSPGPTGFKEARDASIPETPASRNDNSQDAAENTNRVTEEVLGKPDPTKPTEPTQAPQKGFFTWLKTNWRKPRVFSGIIIGGIVLIGAILFWLIGAGAEPLKYDYQKLNTELTQKTKSVPLTGKFDVLTLLDALNYIDLSKKRLDTLAKTAKLSVAETDSIGYYKAKLDKSKTETIQKAQSNYPTTVSEVTKSTSFDTTASYNLLRVGRMLKSVDTMQVHRYHMAAKWLKEADAHFKGNPTKFDKKRILEEFKFFENPKEYAFLNNDQKKEIEYYQRVLSYMEGYGLKDVEAFMRRYKGDGTISSEKRTEITTFLSRRGLYSGS